MAAFTFCLAKLKSCNRDHMPHKADHMPHTYWLAPYRSLLITAVEDFARIPKHYLVRTTKKSGHLPPCQSLPLIHVSFYNCPSAFIFIISLDCYNKQQVPRHLLQGDLALGGKVSSLWLQKKIGVSIPRSMHKMSLEGRRMLPTSFLDTWPESKIRRQG